MESVSSWYALFDFLWAIGTSTEYTKSLCFFGCFLVDLGGGNLLVSAASSPPLAMPLAALLSVPVALPVPVPAAPVPAAVPVPLPAAAAAAVAVGWVSFAR